MCGIFWKLIFVNLLFIAHNSLADVVFSTVVCLKGQNRCSEECYSPLTADCSDLNVVICKNDTLKCNSHCVARNSKQICIPGKDGANDGTLCIPGQGACAGKCYSTQKHICIKSVKSSEVLCTKGKSTCGEHCYSNKTHVCLHSASSEPSQVLCTKDQALCGSKCYNKTDSNCFDTKEGALICGKDMKICGNLGCYSPKSQVCLNNVTCKTGQSLCGSECYDPVAGDLCIDRESKGPLMCSTATNTCESEIYCPKTQECLENEQGERRIYSFNDRKPCKAEQETCGSEKECYSPSAGDQCLHISTEDERAMIVCHAGYSICNYKTPCFNTKTHHCHRNINGGMIFDVICPINEESCGDEACYNPKNKVCVRNEVRDPCQPGEEMCGPSCYNPKTHVCFTLD